MSGYNNGRGYPPGRPSYSPSTPAYGDSPPFRPHPSGFPPGPPPPPGSFPPFPPGGPGGYPLPPARNAYHSPYDEYDPNGPPSLPPPAKFPPFEPGRKPTVDTDVYDPYQPSAYSAGTPASMSTPLSGSHLPTTPISDPMSATSMSARSSSFGNKSSMPPFPPTRPGGHNSVPDLPLLTDPTTVTIGNYTGTVYTLPPPHLPITKYVSVHPGDAIDIHRALCQSGKATSVWYAESSNRAGEGWGSAIEWNLQTGMSGAKLRICAGMTDSLGTELAAINKAVEGFYDQLRHSIRNNKPMSHEFVLFCSSPAAIVSIDTSSRGESIEFTRRWRDICIEFLHAHLTLVYLPSDSQVEGFVLARKIANVASTNSYAKRRRERTIDEFYNRPGGGDPAPSGSTEAGPWQRGDADPSHRKSPFERPKPLPTPEPHHSPARQEQPALAPREQSLPLPNPTVTPPVAPILPHDFLEEEPIEPREALCVTHFPDHITAKDLGILFAQFGDIQAVDIFSIPNVESRFAFVAYASPKNSIPLAIKMFHRQPVRLDTPFARQNSEHLAVWKGFTGVLTLEESDSDRLLPPGISKYFTSLPDYATSQRHGGSSVEPGKRDRIDEQAHPTDSSSPKKRKTDLGSDNAEVPSPASNSHATMSHPSGQASPLADNRATGPPDGSHRSHLHTHSVPTPSPLTASCASPEAPITQQQPLTMITTSPTESQDDIKLSGKTLRAQLNLVHKVFVKHDVGNWIAHTCLIATDLDQARRQLQEDLYATDDATLTSRDVETTLTSSGFTAARIDTFVGKVLKVLDGIVSADGAEPSGSVVSAPENVADLQAELHSALERYPKQTRDAMAAAATVLEYLNRGKEEQEKKRLEVERRLGVMQGMAKIGEQVSKVVSFLLTDS